jgi:tetratricopeptide (TPR) repeat protein
VGKDHYAYSETFYPRYHYGWSELTSYQNGRYKLIIAPRLELYDLSQDPDESINLIDAKPAMARDMKSLADRFIEESGQDAIQLDYHSMDEDARQKLAALGYIGSFTDTSSLSGKSLGDPKDKITIFNRLSHAREMGLEGEYDEAIAMIDEIIEEDSAVISAYFTKGNIQFKKRDFQGALESFLQALERKPDDSFTVINVANSYIGMGEFEEAEKFMVSIKDSLQPDSQIYLLLGNINNLLKDYGEAETYYKECMRLNPSSATAYNALGAVYISQERLDEAESLLQEARDRNSELANLHYNFAQLHEARGDLRKAEEEYLAELEYIPHNFRASFNLARVYRLMGQPDKEEIYLKKAIELNPRFPLSYFYLARIYLNQGEKFDEAIDLVNKGIELKPGEEDLPLGYFLLADLYNRTGQFAKSSEFAAKGQSLTRSKKN